MATSFDPQTRRFCVRPIKRFHTQPLVHLKMETYHLCLQEPSHRLMVPTRFSAKTDNRQMSNGKVEGKVHFIDETKTYGQKGFRKRLVVIEQDNGRFTNYLPMEFIQDACDAVDQLSVGVEVEINYRLSGRKWQRDEQSEVKYFLSAEAMGFEILGGGTPPADEPADIPFGETFVSDEDPPF